MRERRGLRQNDATQKEGENQSTDAREAGEMLENQERSAMPWLQCVWQQKVLPWVPILLPEAGHTTIGGRRKGMMKHIGNSKRKRSVVMREEGRNRKVSYEGNMKPRQLPAPHVIKAMACKS